MSENLNRREFVNATTLAASGLLAAAQAATAAPQPAVAPRSMGARFRALMNGPEPLICPGAFDILSARLCALHGFNGAFIGSSVINQAFAGLPDQAIVTVSEIVEYDSVIASNVDIPVLADVDDFGATPLDVYRFAKQAERGGIGCAAFDDRLPMNRATNYAVPGPMPVARMIDNIHAAADARTDMVIIARCLAPDRAEMLDRAAAYAEAGADAIWLGLPTPQDYARAAGMIRKPLMAGVGNARIPATAEAMKAARITVGQAVTMVNIALGGVDRALAELKTTGRMSEAQRAALSRETSEKIEQVEQLNARSRKYNLPGGGSPAER
jgi:2-methylisocitrate lyase-like PEP mutase family enzyme